MQEIAQWLKSSEEMQMLYITVLMAAMVLPMIALSIWYHRNIGQTEGGKALMERQNSEEMRVRRARPDRASVSHSPSSVAKRNMQNAGKLHGEVMSGKYGDDAKSMQMRVYWYCLQYVALLGAIGALPFIVNWMAG